MFHDWFLSVAWLAEDYGLDELPEIAFEIDRFILSGQSYQNIYVLGGSEYDGFLTLFDKTYH